MVGRGAAIDGREMGRAERLQVFRFDRHIEPLAVKVIAMGVTFATARFTSWAAGHLHAAGIVDEPTICIRLVVVIGFSRAEPVFESLPQRGVVRAAVDLYHLGAEV